MTTPALPTPGSTDWYTWAQAVHDATSQVKDGRLTDAQIKSVVALTIGASFVIHGATASTARPASTGPVVWLGSVAPTNADATLDVWIPVSSDGGAGALASLQSALTAKADLVSGTVPDAQLPARLSNTSLKAAYTPSVRLLYVDSYGADPTGVADSTAAFRAAQTAGGSGSYQLVGSSGTYKLGTSADLLPFSLGQGMVGQGSALTTLNYVGSATCVKAFHTPFSNSGYGGSFSGFTVSGSGAAAGAVGFSWGDMQGARVDDVTVTGFTGAGSVGFLLKNVNGWSEQGHWTKIRALNNTNNIVFDNNSFDYASYEFHVYANANQNGITLQNDAAIEGCTLELRGNFNSGAGSNTGHVIGLDPAGAGVGTSRITKARMFVSVECDGSVGTVGHTSLKLNGSSSGQFTGNGVLSFLTGINAAAFQNMQRAGTIYGFSGIASFPEIATKPGDGLTVHGGTQVNQVGSLATAAYANMLIYCQFGDVQALTLPSGNTTIAGFDGAQQRVRRLELFISQPASGGAGTLTWPGNVTLAGALSTANGAVDKVLLTYLPVENRWIGQIINVTAGSVLAQPYLGIDGDALANGDETQLRRWGGSNMTTTSGTLYLSFFNSRKSETKTKIAAFTNATAAAATPTYAAMGIYSVGTTGALTLLGQCASDTTLFAAAFTQYERALTANVTTVAGQRYAFGLLIVSAAAMPTFYGANNSFALNYTAPPLMSGTVAAQSTLPASVASGAYSGVNSQVYGWMHP